MSRFPPSGKVTSLVDGDVDARRAIEEIFFLSSPVQDFADPAQRAAFFHRWTDYYLTHEPDLVRLYRCAGGAVTGYLTGCLDSREAAPLYRDISAYRLFEPYFEAYPGHFHVNCHPAQRGQGVGTALVQAFLELCRGAGLAGVHVVTATGAGNIAFYRRLGFEPLDAREFEGIGRLLLGRCLD